MLFFDTVIHVSVAMTKLVFAFGFCVIELYLLSFLSASPVQAEPGNVQTDRSVVVSHLRRCSHL